MIIQKVFQVSSVYSVLSDSLWPHGLQHARLPCPSPTPGACLNSYPSSRWCHPTISSSVVPFSSCLQFFSASGSFPISSLHQVAKVLELQLQHLSFQWIFRTDFVKNWLVWPPCSPRDSQESSAAPQFINSLVLSFLYSLTLTPIMTIGKTIALTRWTSVVLPPPSIILLNKYFKLYVSIISLTQYDSLATCYYLGLLGTVLYLQDMYLFS